MSEFIREVDEDYRHDQIRRLLGRYWVALLGVAIVALVSVGVWRGVVYYRQQQNDAAGSRYFDATQKIAEDRGASLTALDALSKDAPAGYRILARFKAAAEMATTDAGAAVRAFDALAGDAAIDSDLREIAKLRAAMLVMNMTDAAEISRRFEPLADGNAPFRNIAREMLALAALKRGEDLEAKRRLDEELSDPTATQDQRQRAGYFLGLIRSGKPGGLAATPGPANPPAAPAAAVPETPPAPAATPAPDGPSESAKP